MSTANERDASSQSEHPSTYFVQDRGNSEELKRLQLQDRIVTASMGGVLPEQNNLSSFKRVLDVGCGSGGWLIATAQALPAGTVFVGVDASNKMIAYAREQAQTQSVSERVEFHVMDALRMLEFPTGFFDLVNQRSATSWIRTWDWPKLLNEYRRVCRPGGIVRITEPEILVTSPSAALDKLFNLMLKALAQAGHLFTPQNDGLSSHLAPMLTRYGLREVQTRLSTLEYRAGTQEGHFAYEDAKYLYRTILPFLRKWTSVPEDYDDIYQQAMRDMQQPDFVIVSRMLTVWGINPTYR